MYVSLLFCHFDLTSSPIEIKQTIPCVQAINKLKIVSEMLYLMQVFHWSCSKSWGSGTNIHQKGRENTGSVAPPRQDVIHSALPGSRSRTSPKPLTDKPWQVPTSRTDRQDWRNIQNPTTRRAVCIVITVFDEFLGKKRIKCQPINNS